MKRLFRFSGALILLLMVTFTVANAQNVGIRAGVLSSKQAFMNSEFTEDIHSKLGADVALVADFPIGIISISPEFHWMQKGAKIEDLNGSIGEIARTFNYLEIPLLVKLNFGESPGFFIFGGPSYGYLLNGSDKDHDGSTTDIDLDFYKRGEWGAHVGAGISLGPIKIDVRYLFGLTNIWEDDTSDEFEIRNSSIGAGVTIMF